jgi:hypothetical protein
VVRFNVRAGFMSWYLGKYGHLGIYLGTNHISSITSIYWDDSHGDGMQPVSLHDLGLG